MDMLLNGADISVEDFGRRFVETVVQLVVKDNKPVTVFVRGVDGANVLCRKFNRDIGEFKDVVVFPYEDIIDVVHWIPPEFYKTPIGTFGLSYTQRQQYRAGHCVNRTSLFPAVDGSKFLSIIGYIYDNMVVGSVEDCCDTANVMLQKASNNMLVCGGVV